MEYIIVLWNSETKLSLAVSYLDHLDSLNKDSKIILLRHQKEVEYLIAGIEKTKKILEIEENQAVFGDSSVEYIKILTD